MRLSSTLGDPGATRTSGMVEASAVMRQCEALRSEPWANTKSTSSASKRHPEGGSLPFSEATAMGCRRELEARISVALVGLLTAGWLMQDLHHLGLPVGRFRRQHSEHTRRNEGQVLTQVSPMWWSRTAEEGPLRGRDSTFPGCKLDAGPAFPVGLPKSPSGLQSVFFFDLRFQLLRC